MAHDQKVVGSTPSIVYWMNVSDEASYYIKKVENNKGSQMGHTKKIFKKRVFIQNIRLIILFWLT
jgi:hypothetical protein